MLPTAVLTAGMTFAVVMVVMITVSLCILIKVTCKKVFNSLVAVTAVSCINFDTYHVKSVYCTATDAAADKNVNACL